MEENLKYMWKTYDFSVPDREYCTDLEGVLRALWTRIGEPPHACLFCNRKFQDAGSCRKHMLDKRHARVGTEARTRRGKTDEVGSQELQEVLEEFYDFHSSTREVTEKIRDPAEKVACLVRFFDEDRDGRLNHSELSELWRAAASAAASSSSSSSTAAVSDDATGGGGDGAAAAPSEPPALSEAMYAAACGKAEVDPDEGLDAEALGTLYEEGLADLDAHFRLLQDLLAQKLRARGQAAREAAAAAAGSIEEGDEENEGGEDAEDDDEESDAEVLECEDEDEFEEVMRVLGLRAASLDDNGDLRLPNGAVAAHRDVAYIWRQRGVRTGNQLAVSGKVGGPRKNAMLMLSNSPAGISKIALSHRQQAREGQKIIAVLRAKNHADMKCGINNNRLQSKKSKIRTGMGDASGGR